MDQKLPGCFLCLEEDNITPCVKCEKINFCKDHEQLHCDPIHKTCYPFKVIKDDQVGKFLIATRDIKEGEMILKDTPAVVGPTIRCDTELCMNCFKINPEGRCEKCSFPVCNQTCAVGVNHIKECKKISDSGFEYRFQEDTTFSAITVLRLLMNGNPNEPDSVNKIKLVHHNEERKIEHPKIWGFEQEHIVNFIQEKLGMKSDFSTEHIQTAMGVLATNSTSLQLSSDFGKGFGLFPVYSMMNHSCMCNTKTVIDGAENKHLLTTFALRNIKEGDQITNQYMKSDKPTVLRRPFLKSKWFFDCHCQRCMDPTELGSHLSSLLCQMPRCGGTVIISKANDLEGDWICLSCSTTVPADEALEKFEELELILNCLDKELEDGDSDKNNNNNPATESLQRNVNLMEEALYKMSLIGHPNNYWIIQVQQALVDQMTKLPKLGRTQIQRKIQLCKNIIDCLSKVESGYSNWFSKLSMEFSRSRLEAGKRDLIDGNISQKQMEKIVLDYRFNVMYLAYQQAKLTRK